MKKLIAFLFVSVVASCGPAQKKLRTSAHSDPQSSAGDAQALALAKMQNLTLVKDDKSYEKISDYFGASKYLVIVSLDRGAAFDEELKSSLAALSKSIPVSTCNALVTLQRSDLERSLTEASVLASYLRGIHVKPLSLHKRFGVQNVSTPIVIDRNGKLVKEMKSWNDLKGLCF